MKKIVLTAAVLAFIAFSAAALEVNEKEIQSVGSEIIQFENYNGPHRVIDSLDSIRSIGKGLGNDVKKSLEDEGSFRINEKYSVIHAVNASEKTKLDADIILINENATVDHIKNLRRIIASYLSTAYGYNDDDAMTVATFVTVYNAVYRGKINVFQEKYKDVVTKYLTSSKCGLSTKWSEWPGQSQIVIPLSDLNGGLSTVDTSVISDKEVVNSMKEEDDKGVDERKNMVDIKEREAEKASQDAQNAQKKAAEESKKLTEQKKNQEEAEKKAEEAKKEAQKDPDNKEKQQAAQNAEKKAENEAEKTAEQQKKTDEAKNEASEKQAVADKKQTEAQDERTEIAKDQQKLLEEAIAEKANQNTVIGLKISDSQNSLSSMVKLDSQTGLMVRESPVTVIRGRTILEAGTYSDIADEVAESSAILNIEDSVLYMAICGSTGSNENQDVRLCLLDAYKMEIQKTGKESVSPDSVLVKDGDNYYCVISSAGKWVIAKYDAKLNLLLKGEAALSPATPITVTSKGIVVTSSLGLPLLLNTEDFKVIGNVNSSNFEK